jgi:hypothetical protein
MSYVGNVRLESKKCSHRDLQVNVWDVQRNLSEEVFPHSLMIQEECEYKCVCVCV